MGRSTGQPEGLARQATKQSPRRWQAIEPRIGENPCEAVSWGVCLAFQSHFRIIAWAGLPLMADLAREHGVLLSAQASLENMMISERETHTTNPVRWRNCARQPNTYLTASEKRVSQRSAGGRQDRVRSVRVVISWTPLTRHFRPY